MPPLPDADPLPRGLTKSTRCFIILNALAGGTTRCPYSEYRAFGHPSESFGLPGDIYLNTKPGYHELFARYPEGWKKWPGPEHVESTLVHPKYSDRYLWLKSDMSTFGWYPKKSLLTLSKNLTISELLCLVLKEQVRVAESNAARKRKKKNNEDIPGVSSPAKKIRGIGSSTCEVLANAIPQELHLSQAPGSIVSHPMSLSAPSHTGMPSSSDTAGSVGIFPYTSHSQSLNSGLTRPAVGAPTPSMTQHYHAHHSSHIPSVPIDPTALIGPSTLLQEHYIRERTLSETHSMEPGPSRVHALGGATTIASTLNSNSRLLNDKAVTHQIPLPHPVNVAAFQEILRLKQENQLLRERLSRYNPPDIRDHSPVYIASDNIPHDHADTRDSSPEFTEGPAPPPAAEDAPVFGYAIPASGGHSTASEAEDDQTYYQLSDAQCGGDGSRSLLSTSTAPLTTPRPTASPPRDDNSGTASPHTPSPCAEAERVAAVTSDETAIDDVAVLQRNTSRPDVSVLASSSRNTESGKQTITEEMRTKAPLTEETVGSENSRKSVEPTAEVPDRLNHSHLAIMFHTSASDVVCRLCLQKSPEIIFHVKTSSTFRHLKDHCEKEHRDICDYLLAKTDRQLFEMNRRVNACTENT